MRNAIEMIFSMSRDNCVEIFLTNSLVATRNGLGQNWCGSVIRTPTTSIWIMTHEEIRPFC
ncbi:MAG: hypothetical protein K0R41_786 [Geminicoccaceae bacterium]|nr:hypothetical protein [Geminicoccaceae bacterium]